MLLVCKAGLCGGSTSLVKEAEGPGGMMVSGREMAELMIGVTDLRRSTFGESGWRTVSPLCVPTWRRL